MTQSPTLRVFRGHRARPSASPEVLSPADSIRRLRRLAVSRVFGLSG